MSPKATTGSVWSGDRLSKYGPQWAPVGQTSVVSTERAYGSRHARASMGQRRGCEGYCRVPLQITESISISGNPRVSCPLSSLLATLRSDGLSLLRARLSNLKEPTLPRLSLSGGPARRDGLCVCRCVVAWSATCWCDVCGPDGARGLGVLDAQPVSCATLPRHVGEAAVPGESINQSVILYHQQYTAVPLPINNYEPQHYEDRHALGAGHTHACMRWPPAAAPSCHLT